LKTPTEKTWFSISNSIANTATVYVYDEIGLWGVSAKDFATELNALKGIERIDLRVNSPGGSVVDVLAMMQALKNHPAKVVAYVDGLAASSASRLILAADEVEMASNAFVMIHNVWTMSIGNAAELRKEADVLDKFDQGLANDYAKRTGKELAEILDLMADDTWFNADEALEFGIVDRIGQEQKAAASVSADFLAKLEKFHNRPADLPEFKAEPDFIEFKASIVIDEPAPPSALEEPTFKPTPLAVYKRKQALLAHTITT